MSFLLGYMLDREQMEKYTKRRRWEMRQEFNREKGFKKRRNVTRRKF